MAGPAVSLALLALCILAEVARELCFKTAAVPLDRAIAARDWRAAATNRLVLAGIAIWAIETLVWIAALQHLPLGVAYPIRALSFAVIPLAAWLLLNERLRASQIAGVALVVGGATCIAVSGL